MATMSSFKMALDENHKEEPENTAKIRMANAIDGRVIMAVGCEFERV